MVRSNRGGFTLTSWTKCVFVRTMLPLVCVGLETTHSKVKSQNALEKEDVPVSVAQFTSGRLKSPTIMTLSKAETKCLRYCNKELRQSSLELGGT